MYLKDAQIGRTYVVQKIDLPFQLERRLEALGMTNQTPVSVLNRKEKAFSSSSCGAPALPWAATSPKTLK